MSADGLGMEEARYELRIDGETFEGLTAREVTLIAEALPSEGGDALVTKGGQVEGILTAIVNL